MGMLKEDKQKKELFDYMEMFDDPDAPDGAWAAMLMEAVDRFNDDQGTNYDSHSAWLEYCDKRRGAIE
jgi:hypothetical protein